MTRGFRRIAPVLASVFALAAVLQGGTAMAATTPAALPVAPPPPPPPPPPPKPPPPKAMKAPVVSSALAEAVEFRFHLLGNAHCTTYGEQADAVLADPALDEAQRIARLRGISAAAARAECLNARQ